MNERDLDLMRMAAKYFEILHKNLADLEARVQALENAAKPGGAIRSPFAQGLSTQLSAIRSTIEKRLG